MGLKNAITEMAKLAERFQEVLNRWLAAEERFAGWPKESN
jgi:hypothetical protein